MPWRGRSRGTRGRPWGESAVIRFKTQRGPLGAGIDAPGGPLCFGIPRTADRTDQVAWMTRCPNRKSSATIVIMAMMSGPVKRARNSL